MIAWPAMLHYAGQDELAYLADEAGWQAHAVNALHLHRDDRVIDSAGHCYRPVPHQDHIELMATGERLDVPAAVTLLQRHEAQAGHCCVAKLAAASVADCIAALQA